MRRGSEDTIEVSQICNGVRLQHRPQAQASKQLLPSEDKHDYEEDVRRAGGKLSNGCIHAPSLFPLKQRFLWKTCSDKFAALFYVFAPRIFSVCCFCWFACVLLAKHVTNFVRMQLYSVLARSRLPSRCTSWRCVLLPTRAHFLLECFELDSTF